MIQALILIFSIINFIFVVVVSIVYFQNNFIILDLETYNTLVRFYNAHAEEYDENGEPIKEEKVGGYGFFQEQLVDCEDNNENEE